MNTIVITNRFDGDKFDSMLGVSLQNMTVKCINVSHNPNSDIEVNRLSNQYVVGLKTALQNDLILDDSIVIFCKSNVNIADPHAIAKLEHVFNTNIDVGVIGVRGVGVLNKSVNLYHSDNNPSNGIVYNVDDLMTGTYQGENKKGFFTNVVSVDDSLIAVRGSVLKSVDNVFTVNTDTGFGIDISVRTLRYGYLVATIDMFIISNEYTDVTSDTIEYVCGELGLDLPISCETFKVDKNFIVDVEL